MKYYICSTSVFDNIYIKDNLITEYVPGGAGIYALIGASVWADDVNLVCGVGLDYSNKMSEWFKNNNLSMDNLRIEDDNTPINNIFYNIEEDRQEIPKYGESHYIKFQTKKEEFMNIVDKNVGIYVFRDADDDFWCDFKKLEGTKAYILWEIASNACNPESLDKINEILKNIDVFSINYEEASSLFSSKDKNEIINHLKKLNVDKVFFRLGKEGQIFIVRENYYFVPSIKSSKVVDSTGGGNSSSGAVLVGFSEGYPIKEIGEMANKSAILCLSQLGIPKIIKKEGEKYAK